MTVDEIDFSKLKPYNKSQYQSFELLWYLICKDEYKNGHFTPIDDSGGGDGVEFYLTLDNGDVWGWQCKLFNRFSEKGRKGQIKASLKKACEIHGESLKKWFLCSISDLTPQENRWFTNELKSVIPTECSGLKLFHKGNSELCRYLIKYPNIGNAFFGTNRLNDAWISSQYLKVMNRVEIKDKYIANLHSETAVQSDVYYYIGGPLLGRGLKKKIEDTTISKCLTEFRDSINEIYEFDCDTLYIPIKEAAINIISDGRTILSDMLSLYNTIIEELDNLSVSSLINEHIEKMLKYISQLQKLYEELSNFKSSEILAPINWDSEDRGEDSQIRGRIRITREKLLCPYFVLRNYWSPIYYVFGNFELLRKSEVHIRGNASKGKSHLVLNLLNQYHDLNLPAIYISAKDLNTEDNIKSQILKVLDLPSTINFHELLSNLNMLGQIHGVKALFIIDGLNESLHWHQIWKNGISEIRSEINANSFNNLIFITTYRSSYEEEIFGDFFYQSGNYDLRIDVSGFDNDNFYDALKKYTDYYNVRITNDKNIISLFRENPLALRIFCITNRGRSVSLSNMTIFDIFEKYIQHCNINIVNTLKLPIKYHKSFLFKKLSEVCNYAWKNNTNRVPLTGVQLSTEELSAIESENLLLYREWGGQENLLFTYDLLAGYLISLNILQQYTDKKSFLSDFNSYILPKLGNDNKGSCHPLFDDILSCLIILSIDKFGFIYGDYKGCTLVSHIVKAVYQSSIHTLRQNEVDIKNYLHQYLISSKDIFSLSSSVAFSTENPLNFIFTSSILENMTIWERDLLWTTKIMEDYRYEKINESVIELIEELSRPNTEHQVPKTTALFLMWLLTTNCHRLRFLATKALFLYAKKQPNEFVGLLKKSISINDLYVPERMLAVAYGFVLVNRTPQINDNCKTIILDIANIVWKAIFTSKPILNSPHINIRHYSQRLIELVSNIFPEDFDKEIRSIYLPCGVTKTDIDKWEKAKGCSGPMRMDFSNYTIGTLIPNGHSYSDPELKQKVRGYIMKRVSELGWSENRFEEVDNHINSFSDYSRHNDSDKIDRFGKKYSWIAYYEVAGILHDNSLIDDEYDKWRPAGIDIDPSFPINQEIEDNDFLDILCKDLTMEEWLNAEFDFPVEKKLYVSNGSYTTPHEFICIYGYMTIEDKSLDRSRFVFIRPFITKQECFGRFRAYLDDMDISRHWLSDVHDNYACCAAEMALWEEATYPNWNEMTFRTSDEDCINAYRSMESIFDIYLNSDGEVEFDSENELDNLIARTNSDFVEFNVLTPTMNYCPSFDCSIGSQMTLAKEIIKGENLYFIPQTFNLEDSDGNLAFYNSGFRLDEYKSQHYSYIRRDILDNFLKRNNLTMIWLIWGEKDYAGRPVLFDKFKKLVDYAPNHSCPLTTKDKIL